MTTKRIVYVVDDGADYRFLLQQLFLRYLPELCVQFFGSGDELCRYVQTETIETRPGLILLDLNMPGLNGWQTLQWLRQEPAWFMVPVVIMSSVGTRSEIEQCYDAGANAFLTKPTEFEKIKKLIVETCNYWLIMNRQAH